MRGRARTVPVDDVENIEVAGIEPGGHRDSVVDDAQFDAQHSNGFSEAVCFAQLFRPLRSVGGATTEREYASLVSRLTIAAARSARGVHARAGLPGSER